ncbi:enoyl-[acyl-carrier-protein] reductase [NADH] [Kitasatospora xanthocidica]|uniref:enoyl-[acyl-carrier-protein] reductase FabV n=1 Tax=Kitasatospora xanthocidica TaxID=83382 RepID=UPI0016745508|nr:enoyl-[acyl-carrier-protein] reductase FabV [Kitasatospora xanthocidica]GHF39234.1 enoyl-[acyl-carrier-protein] reductase [NADH] [Kitasatospora xanthocidica]
MTLRQIKPGNRGFLYVNSHPGGCAAVVDDLWQQTPAPSGPAGAEGPVALIIGSSAGYGLAATVAALRTHGMRGVGIAFEAPETERRTASAGWYRTARTAELAGPDADFTFLNADAFATAAKEQALDHLAARYGRVDYLVYSVAAPRRTDPATGEVHHSAIKPLGSAYRAKTLQFDGDTPVVGALELDPADDAEREATVRVMGGDDWKLWIDALADRGLIHGGFHTVALSYVGSDLTAPIYRAGTIGAAKQHLEETARHLQQRLAPLGAQAHTVVAGAAVTQASTAIPSIALYTSLLRAALGDDFRSTAQQATTLWQQLTGAAPLQLDEEQRIRLDGWELDAKVQADIHARWAAATTDTLPDLADTDWFHTQVGRLYGWHVPGTDYAAPAQTTVPWPAMH